MSDMVQAVISWIARDRGGRQTLPVGPVYSSIARFEDDEHWPHVAWSVAVELDRPLGDGRQWVANIRFLSPNAPAQLLSEGNRFELLEGRRRTGKGVILPRQVDIPAS